MSIILTGYEGASLNDVLDQCTETDLDKKVKEAAEKMFHHAVTAASCKSAKSGQLVWLSGTLPPHFRNREMKDLPSCEMDDHSPIDVKERIEWWAARFEEANPRHVLTSLTKSGVSEHLFNEERTFLSQLVVSHVTASMREEIWNAIYEQRTILKENDTVDWSPKGENLNHVKELS